MENFKLDNDIKLICIKADSFPAGIEAAHEKLATVSKMNALCIHFGISYLHDDEILYMAGAEMVNEKETIPAGCETYTLRRGNYISFYIPDFAKDTSRIEKAFKTLLDDPRIDPNGCCAECYLPKGTDYTTAKDVRCMVRLAN